MSQRHVRVGITWCGSAIILRLLHTTAVRPPGVSVTNVATLAPSPGTQGFELLVNATNDWNAGIAAREKKEAKRNERPSLPPPWLKMALLSSFQFFRSPLGLSCPVFFGQL